MGVFWVWFSACSYLHGVGQGGAHAVARGHGLREGAGALELWVDELEASHTCLHCVGR